MTNSPAPPSPQHEADVPPFLRTPVARLVRALAPTRILLFGSYAKGQNGIHSDVDLLVIADCAGSRGVTELHRRAHQLVASNFPPIDIVLCTPQEAENAADARSPFLQSILTTGVTIYPHPENKL
jgi:uncharacterized protein